nr:hypothetical protein [Desulfobulbaceae bacterium]
MRQIVINELGPEESEKIHTYLQKNAEAAGIAGAFWLEIPEELLGDAQAGHESCGPFLFAIEAGEDFVTYELLVRSQRNLHCTCTAYPSAEQRAYLLDKFDLMVTELGIKA